MLNLSIDAISSAEHRGILSAHAPRSTVNEKNRWYAPGRKNNGDLREKSVLGQQWSFFFLRFITQMKASKNRNMFAQCVKRSRN